MQSTRLTERLRLEAVNRGHADDLWRLQQDTRVAHYWGPWTHEYALEWVTVCENAWASDGISKWIAYDRADGSLVGRGGLSRVFVDGATRLEVGWTIHGPLWGHGYATEIGRAALDAAFGELGEAEVVAFTEPDNVRSRAVMDRLGMTYSRDIIHNDAPFVLYTLSAPPQ